ncbi:MAG: PucR family transcriptional regulator [Bilifractor sp.]|jgi:hypothetical protein
MKLNADIVYSALKERYSVRMIGPKTTQLTISRPELYLDNELTFLTNHLYLATIDHLPLHPKLQKNVVIVVIGDGARLSHYQEKCCLLIIREKADFFSVNQYLCHLFDHYYDWEKQLFDIFLQSADPQEIVDCSVSFFHRPIHVIDASFHFLTQLQGAPDEIRVEPEQMSEYLASFEMITDKHGAVLLEISNARYLCVNLFNQVNQYIGCMYLEENGRPFREEDNALAEFLGKLLERALERNPSILTGEQATLKNALENLVNEYPLTANQKWQLNLTRDGQRYVCISMHSANRLSRLPREYICRTFEEKFKDSCSFPKENAIICFVNTTDLMDAQGEYHAALNRKLKQFLTETSGIAGVSNGFSDLETARIAYIQAESAIENGSITAPDTDLFYFSTYALIGMIINSTGDLPAEAYFSERLQKLIKHDKDAPVSYLETLRVFLGNSMSYSKTANDLYIHRSTVIDRISRIERELNVDLKDPDTRLQLEIILKALEIEDMVRQEKKSSKEMDKI